MGQTLNKLSEGKLTGRPIFPNRFVVEICEKVHTHYRNLRLVNTVHDWVNMAEGFSDALQRWKKRGCPGTSKTQHIELCRKKIYSESDTSMVLVNLNKNLYPEHEGTIFAEGAEFTENKYIHVKAGDIRLEFSIVQFREFASAIREADKKLEDSSVTADVR